MCYLIAKKFDEVGCLAVETTGGKALGGLVTYLGNRMLDKVVQIVTVTDMDTFGEYKPYHLVESESEFITRVLAM